jgi:hypothetical protein
MYPPVAQQDQGLPERRRKRKPVDLSYRIAVRTVLWVIAGAVVLGLAAWWIVTG